MSVLGRLVPDVQLTDVAFASRHRALRLVLWLHLPLVTGVALATGELTGPHAAALWGVLGGVVLCALLAGVAGSRRGRSVTVSIGLLLSADALVHGGGGLTDLHFHFFVVLALIGLYQDWLPFGLSVLLVAVHHLGVGAIAPEVVFSDGSSAQANPLPWALLHAVFVLAMCAAQMAYWHFGAAAQRDSERRLAEAGEETTRALRAATEEAERREAAARREAEAQVVQTGQVTDQLATVLTRVSETGARLRSDADSAMAGLEGSLRDVGRTVVDASEHVDGALVDATAALNSIEELRTSVANIAAIANLIQTVADQTNLLALNATIEAARAGDVGKGFAVVAGEVKDLAGQTATATAKIEATVAEVTAGAAAVGAAVSHVTDRLNGVAETQRAAAGVMDEQLRLAAQTRGLVVSAAEEVAASATALTR